VNIAAGEAGHSVGSVLAERLAGTESFTFDEAGAPDAAALADRTGRAMVVVVRDAHRHPWMRDAAGSVLAADPDAVVVELGLPEWRPDGARGYAATLGGGRASFEALADRLLEPAAAGTPS
jgi:beta-N-acetylhexosaminidase